MDEGGRAGGAVKWTSSRDLRGLEAISDGGDANLAKLEATDNTVAKRVQGRVPPVLLKRSALLQAG